MTNEAKALVEECRLDAKAFRENTVYDNDGDPIRLIANADRLDQYADLIETQAREIERLREALTMCVAEMMRASGRLEIIATCNEDRRIVAALSGTCDYVRSALGGSNE